MVDPFIYHNPTKVYFGNDALSHLHEELSRWGKNALLIYGGGSIRENGIYDTIVEEIRKAGISAYEISGVKPNPEMPLARQGARFCRERGIDMVIAAGGGSVIDTAKVIAGSALYDGDPWDLVKSRAQISHALPIMAIPTMAATGSEMNSCAVITNPDTHEKLGWTTEALRPRVSFLAPKNTFTVPPRPDGLRQRRHSLPHSGSLPEPGRRLRRSGRIHGKHDALRHPLGAAGHGRRLP